MVPASATRRAMILGEIGLETWRLRTAAGSVAPPTTTVAAPATATAAAPAPGMATDWEQLQAAVRDCRSCDLHRTRTQTVFGVGHRAPRWVIVGEAPGAEEDRQGEPIVGAAGKLLDEMLRAVGVGRADVFIANVLKCRPPENRNPTLAEIGACAGHLQAQLDLLAPRLILAVGRIAAQSLLGQNEPVGRLRGRAHAFGPAGIPLVVTYHPAYLLRSPVEKRRAWDDLRLACRLVAPRAP